MFQSGLKCSRIVGVTIATLVGSRRVAPRRRVASLSLQSHGPQCEGPEAGLMATMLLRAQAISGWSNCLVKGRQLWVTIELIQTRFGPSFE